MKTKTILSIFLLILIVNVGFAQICQTNSYQGVLTDAQGNTVSDGKYSLTGT